jgi:hypothetical protein
MPLSTTRLRAGAPTSVAGAADLNVIPVLNMFTILIPFLVSMAAFSHLAVQTFATPGDAPADQVAGAVAPGLTVLLGVDELSLLTGDAVLARLPLRDGAPDFAGLAAALAGARGEATAPGRVLVAVADPVRCADIVACLDCCRAAGFAEVALAAAADPSGAQP